MLSAERLLKPKSEIRTAPPKPPPPEGGGGSTSTAFITAVARNIQNTLWQPNPAPAGLYFLFSVINNLNDNLLTGDRPIALFMPVDLDPLLRQIGQWLTEEIVVQQQQLDGVRVINRLSHGLICS